jgi:hypothetical protein
MIAKTQTLQIQQISTDYHCGHQGPEARSLQKIKKFMRHIHYPDGRKIPHYSYHTIFHEWAQQTLDPVVVNLIVKALPKEQYV